MANRTLIFVGHSKPIGNDLNPCGFATASKVLMESGFFKKWKTVLIDISSNTLQRESLVRLIGRGIKRIAQFTKACIKSQSGVAFIFSAQRMSFLEKILMCIIGALLRVRCFLYVCSGYFMDDVKASRILWFYRWLLSIPSVLICPSPEWVRFYASIGISPEKCVVIPNWIDSESFAKCRKIQPSSDAITFIFIGMLVQTKGVYEFFDAAEKLITQLPLGHWILAGGGTEENTLRELAAQKGLSDRIRVTGWVTREQVIELLGHSDVFVLPTHTDAFPNAILEGMAAGLPVITTAVGGIPGYIKDGDNGLLVPPRDSLRLAQTMLQLAKDYELRKALSAASINYVTRYHDTHVVLKELQAVLSE